MTASPAVPHFHVVVWLDHREARVFHFNAAEAERATVHSHALQPHLHHKSGVIGAGHVGEDTTYLGNIAGSLAEAGEILVVGPGGAKNELMKYLRQRAPATAGRVVAVETVDHPTDGQIVAHARRYFRAADRMLPQGTA